MPRSRKTASGAPAQPVSAMTGQQYGRAVQQEALQQAMPVPASNAPATTASPQPNPTGRPQLRPEDAMKLISGMGGLLSAPDDNPSLPVTDGLSTGPGRGPEAIQPASSLGRTLQMLSTRTGDPFFLELAVKANLR